MADLCGGLKTHLLGIPTLAVFSIILASFFRILGVAFFTLLERKILGVGQERVGPNKVSFFGVAQPFLDVAKLLSKGFVVPVKVFWAFCGFPLLGVSLMLSL